MTKLFELKGNKLYYENGHYLGEVFCDVDGYNKWWPELTSGYLDDMFLISLGNFLLEMNKEWDEEIQKHVG